jgi:HD superfamily phosphohydrolase
VADLTIPEILKEVGLEEADQRIADANRKLEEVDRDRLALTSQLHDRNEQIEKLREIESQVRTDRPAQIDFALKANRELWTRSVDNSLAKQQIYIDDPIYQQVIVEEQIAPIFRHPMVQRLGHIKQLSFSHLTFPAATHSRLSHCLGAAKNAEQAMTRILQKGALYTREGRTDIDLTNDEKRRLIMKAKLAGLLHDLGHGPFGHGLDQYISAITKEPSPDKFYGVGYVKDYLSNTIDFYGMKVEDVLPILDSERRSELEGFDVLISNLIDSPLDVDRMDYLVRDAHMTGLSIGAINIDALLERIMPFEGSFTDVDGKTTKQVLLTFDRSAIPYITHVLYARDSMYLNCYEHPRKVLAERMLTKAVDDFVQKNPSVRLPDLILLTDEELLKVLMRFSDPGDVARQYASALLSDPPLKEVFSIAPRKYAAYLERKKEREDAGVAAPEEEEVPLKPSPQIPAWEDLTLNLLGRNLQRPKEWEKKLADDAGLGEDSWKVVVTIPAKIVAPKFDDIKILETTDSGYEYSKLDKLTGYWENVLKHIGVERYSIRVFVYADLPKEKVDRIYQSAKELFTVS